MESLLNNARCMEAAENALTHHRPGNRSRWAALFVLLTRLAAAAEPVPPSPPGAELFACTSVLAFCVDIGEEGTESLRQQPRESVKATLRYGGAVFPDVAVHIKGSQGSVQSIDDRPALTVSFNKHFPTRRFRGLRKIHFNNEAEDPTFLTDVLCTELFRGAGVPAARAGYATLQLNGRPLGLYVLKEGLTREFLAQHFKQTGGNLYDGGFQIDVNRSLELLQGPGPEGQPKLRALVAAAREPDISDRWSRLARVLDTERFARSLAMQTLTWNWDGYAMARNNYRIYHDPETDRLVFIPHGLDQMFWEPEGPIYPRMRGLVAAAFVGTTEGDRLYRDRLTELHTKLFQVDRLTRRVHALAALIKPFHPDVDVHAARLNGLIAGRIQSVAEQLQATAPSLGR